MRRLLAYALLLSICLFLPYICAAEFPIGPWVFQSNLSESEASFILSSMAFQLDPLNDSRWNISSSSIFFSDANGNLVSSVILSLQCSFNACLSSTSVYLPKNATIVHAGVLKPKQSAIFQAPPSNSHASQFEMPDAMPESQTPLGSFAFSLPPQWLWIAVIAVVLFITLFFLLRSDSN